MTNSYQDDIISSLASLLIEPNYSDMTLKCDGREIKVHQCIVCLRSPVLAAAVSGDFEEAKSKTVNVSVVNVATLERMIKYLYTGDYDDGSKRSEIEVVINSQREVKEEEKNENENEAETASQPAVDEGEVQEHEGDGECDSDSSDSSGNSGIAAGKEQNLILLTNAYVYMAADYYDIPKLGKLAAEKFREASKSFKILGFADVVALVYGLGFCEARELKLTVCQTIIAHATDLVYDEAFMSVGTKLPGLIQEVLPSLLAEYESRLILEMDRTTNATVQTSALEVRVNFLEGEVVEAKQNIKGVKEVFERTLQKANEATTCRHCSKECNLYFQPEYDGTYSVRCVCRTRY